MPAPDILWDEERAYGALKAWLGYVFGAGGLAETIQSRPPPALDDSRMYRATQDPPRLAGGFVDFIATTPTPVALATLTDDTVEAQAQLVRVTVDSAVDAQAYSVSVLGEPSAPYVATVPPDDEGAIRDQVRAAVDALGLAITTADEGADAFTTLADDAGVHLAVAVLDGPMTARIVDDAARKLSRVDCRWTVRFRFVDVRGAGPSATSWARRRAELLEAYMDAGDDVSLPASPGDPYPYLSDVLKAAGLGYTAIVSRVESDFPHNGTVWYDVAVVDVAFGCERGLERDVANMAEIGVQSVTVME